MAKAKKNAENFCNMPAVSSDCGEKSKGFYRLTAMGEEKCFIMIRFSCPNSVNVFHYDTVFGPFSGQVFHYDPAILPPNFSGVQYVTL